VSDEALPEKSALALHLHDIIMFLGDRYVSTLACYHRFPNTVCRGGTEGSAVVDDSQPAYTISQISIITSALPRALRNDYISADSPHALSDSLDSYKAIVVFKFVVSFT